MYERVNGRLYVSANFALPRDLHAGRSERGYDWAPMSDILTPDALRRIDAFYDGTLRPKLEVLDNRRRQVRWLLVKSCLFVLPPIVVLIGGDLLDGVLPISSTAVVVAAWLSLAAGLVFAVVRYFLPGVTAYANYRSRFKQDIVAEIFKIVCPSAAYDPVEGITKAVFDAPGLFNTRGGFQSDDRVRGRIGPIPFEMSEIGRTYTTGTGKHARSYQVFRGLFFHLDVSQRLHGVTLIDPKEAHSHQIGERDGLSPAAFDDPEFDQAFTVSTSNDAETRALLTPAMRGALVALREKAGKPVFVAFKDRRAYVGVQYGRQLFEPGIAQSTSKDAVREIAEHFALIETIVRELNLHDRAADSPPDDSLLQAPGIEPESLAQLAVAKAGTLTTSDIWTMASAAIDDSAKDGATPAPRPEGTRIRFERGPGTVSITYGLRIGFWVMLGVSLCGALLAASALRSSNAPAWADFASTWALKLPAIPWLDAFAADAPTPWTIVGTVVAVLFAFVWTGYVRAVTVDPDRIRIFRGFRPFPRVYRRPPYGRVMRINTTLYIAKSDGVHVLKPTASPILTEQEARWLTAELKRVLG